MKLTTSTSTRKRFRSRYLSTSSSNGSWWRAFPGMGLIRKVFDKRKRGGKFTRIRVLFATIGLFLLYILHDILQEKAFRNKKFSFGWLMTTIELGVFASCASLFEGASLRSRPKPKVVVYFAVLSMVLALSQGSGSAALQYISFPLKVCFKSCKLIPTMMLGIIITGRRYSALQYISAGFMCVSLILLLNAPAHHSVNVNADGAPDINDASVSTVAEPATASGEDVEAEAMAKVYRGVALLLLAIGCDAMVPNIQEKVLSGMGVLAVDMIMWTNMISGIATLMFTIVTGEFAAAVTLFVVEPMVLFWLVAQAVSGYCGLRCYLVLVRECGAVFAVVATSFRKVATIILSFLVFTKPFTRRHFGALFLLQLGVALAIISRRVAKNKNSARLKRRTKL
ncbi:hypothetical protein AAMO2058_000713400 [Amorphochlora amoebiformis]